MVNITDVLQDVDLNKGVEKISFLSQSLTGWVIDFLSKQGFDVSVRWAGLLVLFLSLGLIWAGIKISKPIIKWGLIILAILLILGLIVPVW